MVQACYGHATLVPRPQRVSQKALPAAKPDPESPNSVLIGADSTTSSWARMRRMPAAQMTANHAPAMTSSKSRLNTAGRPVRQDSVSRHSHAVARAPSAAPERARSQPGTDFNPNQLYDGKVTRVPTVMHSAEVSSILRCDIPCSCVTRHAKIACTYSVLLQYTAASKSCMACQWLKHAVGTPRQSKAVPHAECHMLRTATLCHLGSPT